MSNLQFITFNVSSLTNIPLQKLSILLFVLIFNAYTFPFCSVGRLPTSHVGTRNYAENSRTSNEDREPEYTEIGELKHIDFSDPHYQSLGTAHGRLEPAVYAGLHISDPHYQSLGTVHGTSEPAVYAGLYSSQSEI